MVKSQYYLQVSNLIAYKEMQSLFNSEDVLQINFEYPQGFNVNNCKVFVSNLGDSPKTVWVAKIKGNLLTVKRLNSSTADFMSILLFVKVK